MEKSPLLALLPHPALARLEAPARARCERLLEEARASAAADPAHDLSHCCRVLANALAIAEHEGGRREALVAAAFLHDIANLPKNHPEAWTSSERSASRAAEILATIGMPGDSIELACDAILCHSYSRGLEPRTLEGRVFQDADRLDSLGAIGIARTFTVGGALGRPVYSLEDPFLRQGRGADDKAWTLDHFAVKLFKLGERMKTPTGRCMAEERIAVMRNFVAALEKEVGPDLFTSDDRPGAPA